MVQINGLEEPFARILEEMGTLHVKKNNDYGNAFEKGVDFSGLGYASGQMFQKLCRFQEISSNPENQRVLDETAEDTLLDLANYAVMTLQYLRSQQKYKL